MNTDIDYYQALFSLLSRFFSLYFYVRHAMLVMLLNSGETIHRCIAISRTAIRVSIHLVPYRYFERFYSDSGFCVRYIQLSCLQKNARSLKIQIEEEEGLYYPFSENKGADTFSKRLDS